ncbi:hypothetical protein [Cellulomonas sp. URHB0016]
MELPVVGTGAGDGAGTSEGAGTGSASPTTSVGPDVAGLPVQRLLTGSTPGSSAAGARRASPGGLLADHRDVLTVARSPLTGAAARPLQLTPLLTGASAIPLLQRDALLGAVRPGPAWSTRPAARLLPLQTLDIPATLGPAGPVAPVDTVAAPGPSTTSVVQRAAVVQRSEAPASMDVVQPPTPAPPAPPEPPAPVQRADATPPPPPPPPAATPDAAAAPAAPGAPGAGGPFASASAADLDELARRLTAPMLRRMRGQLLVDRERRGMRADV